MAAAPAPTANPLLTAPVLPTLWRLAVPNIVAMVGSAVAAIAETAYVGQLGVASLAGMALVFPLLMLQQMFSGGAMGGGIASLVSRALGAGQVARAEALVVHALGIALVAGVATTVLMLTLSDAVFGLLGGRGEPLAQAVAYANVAFLGSTGVWLLNTMSAVLRATGNMLVPSVILIAVGLVQVALAGVFGLVLALVPDLWTDRFTKDPAVLAAADTYFHWAGPFYALYGAGLSLYSSAIAANRVGGQVMAGTLRLLLVAAGGAALVAANAPAWAIFALAAVGMAAYGTASILLVRYTPWEPTLRLAPA